MKRQRVKFPRDIFWENETYKLKRSLNIAILVVSGFCNADYKPCTPADDTNLTLFAKQSLSSALTPELKNLSCWLKANKLSLNVAK